MKKQFFTLMLLSCAFLSKDISSGVQPANDAQVNVEELKTPALDVTDVTVDATLPLEQTEEDVTGLDLPTEEEDDADITDTVDAVDSSIK